MLTYITFDIIIYLRSDAMHIEYECTLLEIDKDQLIRNIKKLGGKKRGEYFQKRYVYDFDPVDPHKWIRLRTNGKKTTLTIKNIFDKNIVGGTEETEIEVSDFETTNIILNELGYVHRNYQENKRITYVLDDVEIDIDSWPLIPTYAEFEGKNEEDLKQVIAKLSVNQNKLVNCDVVTIYKDYYDIDILAIKELRF